LKNDREIWDDFLKGENYAISHIYYNYVDQLYRYGMKFTTDKEVVKDTIQDLFFDLLRTRAQLGQTDHIYFYLIKSLRRRLFLVLNSKKTLHPIDYEVEPRSADIVYSAEDELIRKEQLSKKEKIIKKSLEKLSPRQREIIYYRYTCDFDYDQICELMSIKYDSARKMVFRAIQTLREDLLGINMNLLFIHFQVLKYF
jgi:RNA polymerase sigma factor (sigma-70 family)